jgi:hypothetical protein
LFFSFLFSFLFPSLWFADYFDRTLTELHLLELRLETNKQTPKNIQVIRTAVLYTGIRCVEEKANQEPKQTEKRKNEKKQEKKNKKM